MATKYIDTTGKTVDEAIAKALAQLGLERDDVSVEVLEQAKRGFFGIGASPAKVRVTYGLEEAAPVSAPAPSPKPAPAPATKKIPEKKEKPVEKDVPAKPVEKKQQPVAEEKKETAEGGEEKPSRRDRRRRGKGDRREKPVKPVEENVPSPAPEDLGDPCDDAKAQEITAFLTGLLEHMGSSAQVKVYKGEENRYKVILEGEKLGQLIGRRGETLDAIQQLTNYAVNKGNDKRVRVHVDAENYRLKREQSLQNLARKMAAKAVREKRNCTLEPMNPYERHVIHTALQDVENVTTYSMGTEPNRRVIIAYDRNKQRQ